METVLKPDKLLKGLWDYLPFTMDVLVSPKQAIEQVRLASSDSKARVEKLGGMCVIGLGVSYVIVGVVAPVNIIEGSGKIAKHLQEIGKPLLPVVLIIFGFIFAVVFHAMSRLILWLERQSRGTSVTSTDANLGGTIRDTLDATYAFLAVFIPFLCLCISLFGNVVPAPNDQLGLFATLIAVAPAVFAVVYFPWLLSACHKSTTWLQAMFACSLTITVAAGVLYAVV